MPFLHFDKKIRGKIVLKCSHERKCVVLFLKQWYNFKKKNEKIGNLGDKTYMELWELNNSDRELIEIGLKVLKENFDDGIYNHTVGCALRCKNGNIYKGG